MGNHNTPKVLIYATTNPEKVLDDIQCRGSVNVLGVNGKEVYTETRYRRRVFYYPISNNGTTHLLIGVVGSPSFIKDEKAVQEERHGEGALVNVTEKLSSMKSVFTSLNKIATEQRF